MKGHMQTQWHALAFGAEAEDPLWEVLHENSKLTGLEPPLSNEELREYVADLYQSLPFDGFPIVSLPKRLPRLRNSLDRAMRSNLAVRKITSCLLPLNQLAALLHYSFGATRIVARSGPRKSLRILPPTGTFYSLEIFIHAANVRSVAKGLYHYNPFLHHLRLLRDGNLADEIVRCFAPNTVPTHASLVVFITAIFERATFVYGNRGYRFALKEAGSVAQNFGLVSSSLGLASIGMDDFLDRRVDAFLQVDGITHSAVHTLAIGKASRQRHGRQTQSQ
jgi:SagB-type dehydrogenase family enzyme